MLRSQTYSHSTHTHTHTLPRTWFAAGDQQQPPDERPATSRRCMVKLGVRVIHKIASSVRCTDELTTAANVDPAQHAVLLPKTLRLRLSPKAQHQQTDEQIPGNSSNIHARSQQQRLADESADEQVAGDNDGGGSQSRIDIERGTAGNDSKVIIGKPQQTRMVCWCSALSIYDVQCPITKIEQTINNMFESYSIKHAQQTGKYDAQFKDHTCLFVFG